MENQLNDIIDTGGYATTLSAIVMAIWNHLPMPHLKDINEVIITVTGIVGLVFMIYKLRGQMLDNRLKKKDLDSDD